MARATLLIVDDHAGFRQAARALLEAEGFDVVGEAADGHRAIEQARRLHPQVVLLDVQLPDLNGFAVADALAVADASMKVVLVSSREAATYGERLTRTRARGFLHKRDLTGPALAALL